MTAMCYRQSVTLFAILLMALIGPLGAVHADGMAQVTGRLTVVWVEDDVLWAWTEGADTPWPIAAAGGIAKPMISPDGHRVLFRRGSEDVFDQLWAVGIDGADEIQLIGPAHLHTGDMPRQIDEEQLVWADPHTVYFNTGIVQEIGRFKADDLWRVDVRTGQVERLLEDGEGGNFAISPTGEHIALVVPGRYGEEPGIISVVAPDGSARRELFTFPAVSSGSQVAFYPRLQWAPDGESLLVAIPDPDMLYYIEEPPPVAIWRLPLDGEPRQVGSVEAFFFGLPIWSPDVSRMAYIEMIGPVTDNRIGLALARWDGTDSAIYAEGTIGELEPIGWSPGGDRFYYRMGPPGEVWAIGSDPVPIRFPQPGEGVFALTWADATTAVYASAPTGEFELRVVDFSGPVPRMRGTVAGVSAYIPDFDAVRSMESDER